MMWHETEQNPWQAFFADTRHGAGHALELESGSEAQTETLGATLARLLPAGATICLTGDLGTGKTVFARGFAHGLGISGPVTSPTFTLVNSYEGRDAEGAARMLHHFDLYRILDATELDDIGWEEYFDGLAICLVEWPDRADGRLPADRFGVTIMRTDGGEDARCIRLVREGGDA